MIPGVDKEQVFADIKALVAQEVANMPGFRFNLDEKPDNRERRIKETLFNEIYAKCFAHGTDGHNLRMLSARQTELLEQVWP